jgi:hypothetical protein
MAVIPIKDLIARISPLLGDDNSDENLTLLEDITDTVNAGASDTQWETKYNDLAKRYRQRFESAEGEQFHKEEKKKEEEEVKKTAEEEKAENITIEDLFKEE